jgi:hypothetical protein
VSDSARSFDSLKRQDLVITDRGRPTAVLVHIDRWNSLQAQVEWMEGALAEIDYGLPITPPREPVRREPGPILR